MKISPSNNSFQSDLNIINNLKKAKRQKKVMHERERKIPYTKPGKFESDLVIQFFVMVGYNGENEHQIFQTLKEIEDNFYFLHI